MVCEFDVRNTSHQTKVIHMEGSRAPVVSIQYMPHNPDSTFSPGGLVVGLLGRTMFYEKRGEDYKCHMLSVDGGLTSLSIDPDRRVMTSHRPTANHPAVRHQVSKLNCEAMGGDPMSGDHACRLGEPQALYGGSTATLLSRSRLLHQPLANQRRDDQASANQRRDDSSLLVVAPDEASHSVYIWEGGQIKQKVRLNAPVLDLCQITHQDTHYLAALTQKQVIFSKWR